MTETRLRDAVGEFAYFLDGLTGALDETEGWYGVFVRRDPDGLRACLEGREVPPWDVVASLLQDLAGRRGARAAAEAEPRARQLHGAAAAAYDALTGGPEVLRDRLGAMLGELRHTARRERDLHAALQHADPATNVAGLAGELAWVRDDAARARARVAELERRIEAAGETAELPTAPAELPTASGPTEPAAAPEPAEPPAAEAPAVPKRPRGARFAGLEVSGDGAEAAPPAVATPPTEAAPSPAAPRGARFAGVYEEDRAPKHAKERDSGTGAPGAEPQPLTPETRQAVTAAAARLAELRAAGSGGEAHALLCTAADRPAAELPYTAEQLERYGLAADVPTLLWEVACLPSDRLAAAAEALAAAGRDQDCASLLRQGVARPVAEVASAALALRDAGRTGEARELLAALVRVRTAQEAAGLARATDAPEVLLPLLLEAAAGVAPHCHRDLVHALRTAGVPDRLTGAG
ncbi:hypothetical protein [Streptomyces ochraceiscleroticus]|uniref:UL36 very large tegument protein n=1 Tax=Streptomyces ochraceiscleroticus TaxID=47761 RepID=A0ABW1MSK6_9ACTN|nr:hypothetical protein [Streptomyces ochraceiscleroticus]